MRKISLALLAVTALAGVAGAADYTPTEEDPKKAHAETDRNKDGHVDRGEFHQRIVDIFYLYDVDKNGDLSTAEFAKIDTPTTFGDMDDDGNGAISLKEFTAYRSEQFDDADGDDDGVLTVEEVEAYVGS